MSISRRPHRRRSGYHVAAAFILGVALVVGSGHPRVTVSAQTAGACELLTAEEIQTIAVKASVASGVSNALPGSGYGACRYSWGDGVNRFTLEVVVTEAARMFPGLSSDQIKQQLLGSVRPGTSDAVISEVGDTAVFKPDSPVYAGAMALVGGRILQVHLEGAFAREMKDQIVGLLKSAAARM